MKPRKWLVAALAIFAIFAIGSSARSRPSPAHVATVAFDARTPVPAPIASLLRRACFDCHSEETRWPWYTQLPLASHLIERDVNEGRAQLNWSRWAEYNPFDRAGILDKACELASTKAMPPWRYRVLHSEAQLTSSEVAALCKWTEHEANRLTQGGS
jgi:hypothetical protein